MPEFTFEGEIGLANLLKEAGLVASTSEANRMVQQGGVKIDGEKVEDAKLVITASTAVYQVGKRKFAKVTVKSKHHKNEPHLWLHKVRLFLSVFFRANTRSRICIKRSGY